MLYHVNASDLALCQRCPALFAHKIHRNKKSAWNVGINGVSAYGSIFHINIAQVFFEAASNPKDELHNKILKAIPGGYDSLEKMIRENIFVPFVERNSENLTSCQILSMAKGVKVWVKAMSEFFRTIPSLLKNPAENMRKVFIKPEGKLEGVYKTNDSILVIHGRYDALMLNPDKAEARLFEFKGFRKSDIMVSLSQSLIYSWLIAKTSKIIPSIEIIYLDDNKAKPEIFDSGNVREMIANLPNLFNIALSVISLSKERFKILRNKNLCSKCKFNSNCESEINKLFKRKRRGASLISVIVFFMAVMMISSQAFFFSKSATDSLADDRELVRARMILTQKVEEAKTQLSRKNISDNINYKQNSFYKQTALSVSEFIVTSTQKPETRKFYKNIHYLDYTFENIDFNQDKWEETIGEYSYKKIFPAMGQDYYLIRAFTRFDYGKTLMYQVLVDNSTSPATVKSFEEIWY